MRKLRCVAQAGNLSFYYSSWKLELRPINA